jgi:hypothetical protein
VASVTLPGLLAAGGLTLILWPAIPVDLIPLATVGKVQDRVQDLANFNEVPPSNAEGTSVGPDVACPGEYVLGRHNAYDQACQVESLTFDQVLQLIKTGKPSDYGLEDIAPQLNYLELQNTYPQSRKQQIEQQLILDFENQKFSECIDLETSLKGRETTENLQLKADLDIEEKQRSAAQDNYLASLKSNNPLSGLYLGEMNNFQGCIALKRYSVLWNERDILERDRRVTDLARDQSIITARLADPGRLRPRLGFDDFLAGLVNHVVAFILLSLAAAIIVTALDRTLFFGGLFEDLFDGF